MEKLQLKIGGMVCSFCSETLKKGSAAVAEVNVSLAHEEALVAYDPHRVDAATIAEALSSFHPVVSATQVSGCQSSFAG